MSVFRVSTILDDFSWPSSRDRRTPAPRPEVPQPVRSSAEVLERVLADSARRIPEPAACAEPAPPPIEPVQTEPERGGAIRVLLAEDHPVNRKVVELILSAIGAEITAVENGALAVEAFGAQRFDVVLMDMQMPVMDGLTAIRQIRALESARGVGRTPILSLTANAMPEHVDASFAAGADDHLTKPVSAPGLIAAIQQHTAAAGAETVRRAG